ncbi:MAG TPA: serine/threonine-protein kinase [Gemmatimonadales bacterium]|nr:serine/threonine-protein kinase [Gemmatimonadales bacterium]
MTFCTRCGTSLGAGVQFCPRCGTSIPVAAGDAVATVPMAAMDTSRDALLAALRRATLGEYEILAELGRGGMATVFLAHDLPLDRKVAIKVLAPALLLMGEGMVERFKREARTSAALSHPHIIPIYAVKESDRILYFVMKYVQGRALDTVIHDVGPLPIPMVQAILAQVGDALAYAHRHGVIHRDIKSANIMLDEEGWAVITDFGIAKVEEAQGLTMTGVTVGTPAYMSPEQCATCEVTGASDQYSLGVVAYEMLTGHLPFKSESTMSVMYAHYNAVARPVTELRPDCPPNLAAAVMQMLEKEPEDRWPTMDDVVAVCGRPSLRRDDPIRSEMITLAKAGPARLLPEMNVPTSPIALAKSRRRPATSAPHRAPWVWWGVGAVGLAVALWFAAPWRLLRAPAINPADTVVAPRQVASLAAESAAVRRTPDSAVARGGRPPAPRTAAPATPPAALAALSAAAESVLRAAAVRQEDSLVRSLRTTALAAMRRALEAGATPNELARGDTMVRAAESLAAGGRLSEAMVQFVTARSLWSEAERVARDRAVALAVRDTTLSPGGPVLADPRVSIERAVAEYARALESRDTGQVRRAYPGLTASQQQGWGDFFRAVRNIKASLTITTIDVTGGTAEAIVSGVYEYVDATSGRIERRPVTFRASLVSGAAGWRISAIH